MAEKNLGYRRVQCAGRGSYIISLPKEWVQDVGLTRGNEIDFSVQSDSSLILVPRKLREKSEVKNIELKEYFINVNPKDEKESTFRMIRALYAVGADIICIHFKSEEDASKHKAKIIDFARNTFLGSEVIDETPDEITLQILIKHSEFPIEKAVRRMATVALSANKDAINAVKNRSMATGCCVICQCV